MMCVLPCTHVCVEVLASYLCLFPHRSVYDACPALYTRLCGGSSFIPVSIPPQECGDGRSNITSPFEGLEGATGGSEGGKSVVKFDEASDYPSYNSIDWDNSQVSQPCSCHNSSVCNVVL